MVFSDDEDGPVAGPSRPRAIYIDESSDEDIPHVKRARHNETPSPSPPSTDIVPKADYLVPTVLSIIPDLDPKWAEDRLTALIEELKRESNVPGQEAVGRVIDEALEMESGYPKAGAAELEEEGDYTQREYREEQRDGDEYHRVSYKTLESLFPLIPIP